MKQTFHKTYIFFCLSSIAAHYAYAQQCIDQLSVASSIKTAYYNNLNSAQLASNSRVMFPYLGDPINLATIAGNPGGQFGSAIATNRDGSVIAIAAKQGGLNGTGVVYIFAQHFSAWDLVQILTPSDGRPGDQFGHKIAISADGTTIVIGAPYAQNNAGAVYIFNQTRINTWTQTQKLLAPSDITNIAFGRAISLSYDARVLIVAAPGGELYDIPTQQGYVYSFIRDPNCNTPATWKFEQAFSGTNQTAAEFGAGINLNGDGSVLVVGAPGFNYTVANEGGVFLYTRYADDSGWNSTQPIFITPDPTINGSIGADVRFGSEVAINGDASTLFIGAPGFPANGTSRPGVVFYSDRPIQFPTSQRILQVLNIPTTYVGLGSSMALSFDGRSIIIGTASNTNGGYINVFVNASNANSNNLKAPNDTSYREAQNLRPITQATTFGTVCALSCDGGYCIASDPNYLGAGVAFVYRGVGAMTTLPHEIINTHQSHISCAPCPQCPSCPPCPPCPKPPSLIPLYALSFFLLGYCLTR